MNKDIQYSTRRGFTLIELLLTIGLFIFMTSVVLAKYRSFSINSVFANAVEGVALSLREAQVYGSGSKTAESVTCGSPASSFNCAYGVRFPTAGTSYIIFVDKNDNKIYNSEDGELIKSITLPSGISISDFNPSASIPIDIVFKRPFPDAIIEQGNSQNASMKVTDSRSGKFQTITISSAGLISVQ